MRLNNDVTPGKNIILQKLLKYWAETIFGFGKFNLVGSAQ